MNEATVEEDYVHTVFQVDPRGLLALVGKYVQVTTQTGGVSAGFLFAADPVSKSLVISLPAGDTFTSRLHPGDSVTDIIERETPPGVELTQEIERSSRLTAEEAKAKRETIVQWLRKNLLPVSVKGELIDVHEGSLLIYPPYESSDCVTDNPIVLGRMQHLLRSVPKE